VGKTRLALQVTADLRAPFAAAVAFVALAPIADPARVVATIAQTLGVREVGGAPLRDTLRAALQDRRFLLALDNFEHVAAAAPEIVALLMACPQLVALVTSRAVLRVRGEQEYPVPPLALPDLAHVPTVEEVASAASVELFVHRAQAVSPAFALTSGNAAAVAAICRRLDGLPLALELAAARIKLLAPTALLARLDRALPLLIGGARDLPARQQTMRQAVAWSYDLLDADVQTLFRRLSVFAGGCTLEAAEAVCTRPGELAVDVLGGLSALVEASLLLRWESAQAPGDGASGEPRLRLLETIREYGLEHLAQSGEEAALRRQHARYYLAFAEVAQPHLSGAEQLTWFVRLEQEHDNLRAALHWLWASGDTHLGLRLAVALWWFWRVHGYITEGQGWLEEMLVAARSSGSDDALLRAQALFALSVFTLTGSEHGRARALAEESLMRFRDTGNAAGTVSALYVLGEMTQFQGQYEQATALYEEVLVLARRQGDTGGLANALVKLGEVARDLGHYDRARLLCEESLGLYRGLRDAIGIAYALDSLARAVYSQGNFVQAATLVEEALSLSRGLGDTMNTAYALSIQGDLARAQGNAGQAMVLYGEALDLVPVVGNMPILAACLEGAASIAAVQGQAARAARLYGAVAALRQARTMPLPPADRPPHDRTVDGARTALGDDAFAAAWTAGQALAVEAMVAEALDAGRG
jgi:predicted ATPase